MKRYYNPISDSTSNTNIDDLPWDPAERKEIASYHPNQRDEIR
ncbi:unnamed protein product, partial [Arabidopsis halleri]